MSVLDCEQSFREMNWIIYTGSAGFFITLFSNYVSWTAYPYLFSQIIKARVVLNNGTEAMDAFNVPQQWLLKVFIFNITNPEEIIQGSKAMIDELGPYIYDQRKSKVGIMIDEDDTLSYRMDTMFYFNANKSAPYKESDLIIAPNIPLLEVAYLFEEIFPAGSNQLNSIIPGLFPENENLFIKVSVGDLLFNGIRTMCRHHLTDFTSEKLRENGFPSMMEVNMDDNFVFCHFKYNISGSYKIKRGNKNIHELGKIVEYNGNTYLKMWDRKSCKKLGGTDWSIFSPQFDIKDLVVFTPELCLQNFAFCDERVHDFGLNLRRYLFAENNFKFVQHLEENTCQCKKEKQNLAKTLQCLKHGVFDTMGCQGVPYIYSFPHAVYSAYGNDVDGYNNSNHQLYDGDIVLDPKSGIPLYVNKRLQRNILLRKLDKLDFLANVREHLIPLIWTNEGFSDEQIQINLRRLKQLYKDDELIKNICALFFGFGIFLLITAYFMHSKYEERNQTHMVKPLFKPKIKVTYDGYY